MQKPLFETENVDEFLSKATMMSYISNYDKDILNDLKHDKINTGWKNLNPGRNSCRDCARNLEEKSGELELAATQKQNKMMPLEGMLLPLKKKSMY